VEPDTGKEREPMDSFTDRTASLYDNMTTANDSSICNVVCFRFLVDRVSRDIAVISHSLDIIHLIISGPGLITATERNCVETLMDSFATSAGLPLNNCRSGCASSRALLVGERGSLPHTQMADPKVKV